MSGRLRDKVAIITGGAQGQGAAEARLFAREGAAVAICDINEATAQAVAGEINAEGGKAQFFRLDVTSEENWQSAGRSVSAWAGKINILINNAGIISRKGITKSDLAEWKRILDVNLTGPYLGLRYIAPYLRRAGGGSVINISSVAGLIGYYDAAYTASKWGLRGLTKTAALEFGPWNIRVNTISPGLILTPMNASQPFVDEVRKFIPRHIAGAPTDVAALALFLASDESNFINGEDITADGGMMAGTVLWRPLVDCGAITELSPDSDGG